MLRDAVNATLRRTPSWPLYPLGTVPVVWLYWQGLTGGLGVEPVEVIEHRLGLWGLWLLIASLCVTPLCRIARLNLMKFRRAIGLMAFFYVLVHLLTWAILDVQSVARVWVDILKRPYITIGMAAFALLIPLALTSTNAAVRRLGPQLWRQIHWLVYPAALLGAMHYVMLVKGWQVEPLLYLTAVICVLMLRIKRRSVRRLLEA